MTLSLFRYSGSKGRYLSLLPRPPKGTKRIVELYLGSGAYSLNYKLPSIGYETNPIVCELWWWLQSTTADELRALNERVEWFKSKEEKPDVRKMKLDLGPETYVRVNITGLIVGQLSSWKVYPQHSLPLETTIAALNAAKRVKVVNKPASRYVEGKEREGDFVFVDPPYVGTTANYKSKFGSHEAGYTPKSTRSILRSVSAPIAVTYGTDADVHFPKYEWQQIACRRVPNVRCGGTVLRTENLAKLNWR